MNIDSGPYKMGKNVEDAHVYRPGHPLAQRILSDEKEESFDHEIVKKTFSLSAVSVTPRHVTPELHKKLDGLEQRFVSTLFAQIAERNGRYFDDEIDKLDNWVEDKRRSLKIQLKEYDDQIMALKKEGRTALNLPEKLTAQKKIRDLDAKRNVPGRNMMKRQRL